MTIREFGRVVWTGKWYVLGAVILVIAATMWFADRQVTEYQATTVVQLEESTTGNGSVVVGDDAGLVTSPVVATAADAVLDPPTSALESVDAVYDAETQTLVVSSQASDPQRAVALSNAYAQAHLDHLPTVIEEQVTLLDEQIAAVSEQVREARETLEDDKDDPVASALEQTGNESLGGLTSTLTAYLALVRPGYVAVEAVSATPVGLDTTMMLAVAVLAGIVAGVGAAFLRYALDMRVRSSHEVSSITEAPVLAGLADARKAMRWARSEGTLPVATRVATPFTESVRELRTAIQVDLGERQHGTVVVSAADPRAPRAFVAANLAASFALSGRRTVVLSGDLRRPQIDALLPPPEGWDGSRGQMRPSIVPNLDVCPMPDVPLDPADYLASERARDLVEAVKRRADIVVVDAPPVLAAADATILGSYADGVVLVAEVRRTDRAILAEAAQRLRTNSVRLIGVAVAGRSETHRAAYAATYGDVDDARPGPRDGASPSSVASASSAEAGVGSPGGRPGPWARLPFVPREASADSSAEDSAASASGTGTQRARQTG
ncbi:hypothetical protein GCM10009718_27240 [Isoptericola halotolerans]|uniref:Mrp family chromosome partitioning ATPase n=1 Tax=Isoptericola halotolerans TaxID=300560 RepID=A0ABX2A3J6_9MICO|nr:polysaccharide biosynthesis tyrosine autokinase [Isoptericola halotolerans]NOV97424.1 Mrp family chromosome partitioning ATPase [Isoptericola halotolerans]